MNNNWPLVAGATFALLSVAAGAFAAHGLQSTLGEYGIGIFRTAAAYQMYHALALILVAVMRHIGLGSEKWLAVAALSFTLGILIFSGSLYVLALSGLTWLGAITPVGGLAFLAGWVAVIVAGVSAKSH